jgi:hypothetical protein
MSEEQVKRLRASAEGMRHILSRMLPTHDDPDLRESAAEYEQAASTIEALLRRAETAERERDDALSTADRMQRNRDYNRAILMQIGALLGPEAHICDDGTTVDEPLVAKVVELVEALKRERGEARAALALIRKSTDDAMADILAERRRQIEVEGWTPQHDDAHKAGDMLSAAMCYLGHVRGTMSYRDDGVPMGWPWDAQWWKPKDARRDLVRAGALCLAERERIQRKQPFRRERFQLKRPGEEASHVKHKLDIIVREIESLSVPSTIASARAAAIEEAAKAIDDRIAFCVAQAEICAESMVDQWSAEAAALRPLALHIRNLTKEAHLCEDCPPVGYPTEETRCLPCPRRNLTKENRNG